MKKLTLAAIAAFAIGCVAQATTVQWSLYTDGEDGSPTFTDWSGASINTDTPATMFLYAVGDTGITYDNKTGFDTTGATLIDTRTYGADGFDGWGSAYDDPIFETGKIDAAASQNFQYVLIEGTASDITALGDGKYYYLGNSFSVDGEPDPTPGKTGFIGYVSYDMETSIAKGDWAQTAPEPTSGLLLLIGVAGLALRRRRA